MGRLPWWEDGSVFFTWLSTGVFFTWTSLESSLLDLLLESSSFDPLLECLQLTLYGVFTWPSLESSLDPLWNLLYSTLCWSPHHLTLSGVSFTRPSTGAFFIWPSTGNLLHSTLCWSLLHLTLCWSLLHSTFYWSLLHLILSKVSFTRPSTLQVQDRSIHLKAFFSHCTYCTVWSTMSQTVAVRSWHSATLLPAFRVAFSAHRVSLNSRIRNVFGNELNVI